MASESSFYCCCNSSTSKVSKADLSEHQTQQLLENYSKVPKDQQSQHAHEIVWADLLLPLPLALSQYSHGQ
jgi:hypothetical protein